MSYGFIRIWPNCKGFKRGNCCSLNKRSCLLYNLGVTLILSCYGALYERYVNSFTLINFFSARRKSFIVLANNKMFLRASSFVHLFISSVVMISILMSQLTVNFACRKLIMSYVQFIPNYCHQIMTTIFMTIHGKIRRNSKHVAFRACVRLHSIYMTW